MPERICGCGGIAQIQSALAERTAIPIIESHARLRISMTEIMIAQKITVGPGVATRMSANPKPPSHLTVPAMPSSASPAIAAGILARARET